MGEVRIRRALWGDVEQVAAFQAGCWAEAYRGLVPDSFLDAMDLGERAENWRRRIEQREREVLVASRDGGVVGVVSWTPGEIDELNTLYVAAVARGTGLAARLLADSLGHRPAALWVFSGNVRARRFYAKQGFRPSGEQQVDSETGVDEVRLSRLSSPTPDTRSSSAVSLPAAPLGLAP